MLWVEVKDEELECVVTRSLVSLELARMTNSLYLGLAKVIVILNNEERGDSESTVRLCSGLK
ncbi:hypothetical protein B4U81_14025 [Vibrio campbellii]|nr:hypothetical protein B4U81_14025 [Vibrio campbellii]